MLEKTKARLIPILSVLTLLFLVPAAALEESPGQEETSTAFYEIGNMGNIATSSYTDENGLIFDLTGDRAVVIGFDDNLPVLTIPGETKGLPVTEIAEYAFASSERLFSVTIPDSVVKIGKGAFSEARNLVSIEPGNGISEIPFGCFAGCDSLKQISLPGSLKKIDALAFSGCTMLGTVSLSDEVTEIAPDAFEGCESLIIDCPDGSYAAEYAKKHAIDRSFFTSSTFVLLVSVLLAVPLLAAFIIIRKIIIKKNTKSKSQSEERKKTS